MSELITHNRLLLSVLDSPVPSLLRRLKLLHFSFISSSFHHIVTDCGSCCRPVTWADRLVDPWVTIFSDKEGRSVGGLEVHRSLSVFHLARSAEWW